MKINVIISLILILLVSKSWATEDNIIGKCETLVSKKFSQWRKASVTSEVAEWARSRGESPTEIYGDFDGNTDQDVALLIQVGSNPKNTYPERLNSLYIAVCLNNPPLVTLYLIDRLYCGDLITLSHKGKSYYNYETGKTGRYPLDGIGAICFEKAGATYLYDGAKFIKIVDSD